MDNQQLRDYEENIKILLTFLEFTTSIVEFHENHFCKFLIWITAQLRIERIRM